VCSTATKTAKHFLSLFLILFLFASQLAIFQFTPKVNANPDWLSGWTYRKSHEIYNATGAGTNYQIRIKVHFCSFRFNFSQVWDSGTIATGTALDTARNQIVDGDYLYAVSSTGQKLVIYDISDPSNPAQKSLTSLDYYGIDIRKKGNYLFISCNNGVQVWDVSDVTSPSLNNTIFNDGEYVHGMFLSGDYLYCCRHKLDKFVIVDVSDPTNPVVKGSLSSATYFNGCHDVHVEGNYAYVTNYLSGTGEYGFIVVDISDKNNPSVVGYTGEGHKNSHVFKVGNYCYVGSHSPDSGMRIYNVTTPSSPSYEGQYFTSEGTSFAYWIDDYDSNTLTAIALDSNKLYLIDISNPTSPSIKTAVLVGSSSNPKNVVYSGGYFYVSWNDESSYDWHIRSYQLTTASDSGEDVYLNEHCRTDFGDIRFTGKDSSGNNAETNLLDYWMEEKVDSDYAIFWVELQYSLDSENQTIYIYYGKSDAITTSIDFREDFTTYTEVDPNSHISKTTHHIDFDAYYNEDARLYKDYGVDHFGNFKHLINFQAADSSTGKDHAAWIWVLTDTENDTYLNSRPLIAIMIYHDDSETTKYPHIYLREHTTSGLNQDVYIGQADTWYYLTILKYGTSLKCEIYSDSTRTNLLDTLSITLGTDYSFRYLRPATTHDADLDQYLNLDIEDLALFKYVDPEPSHGSWGTEEEVQTEYSYTLWTAITPTETMEYAGEGVFTFTQTITPTESINYWQEQVYTYQETTSSSLNILHWLETAFDFSTLITATETLEYGGEALSLQIETITPSESISYLQERQYILTETTAPTVTFKRWVEGITVFTETFTETLQQITNMHYWIETAYTFTTTINPFATFQSIKIEASYVFTQTVTPSETITYYQEHCYTFTQPSALTTTLNIAKELAQTFITNIETLTPKTIIIVLLPEGEVDWSMVAVGLALLAFVLAVTALAIKRD